MKIKKNTMVFCLLVSIATIMLLIGFTRTGNKTEINNHGVKDLSNEYVKGISDKILRFRVIGNSNSLEDQSVKLTIRDKILAEYRNDMLKCKNKSDAMMFLCKQKKSIEKTADSILQQNNFGYKATAFLGNYVFPPKQYGDIVLPSGKYTAFKVVLGKGDGRNWWCVMFPPLCFIDITSGKTNEASDEALAKTITHKTLDRLKINNASCDDYKIEKSKAKKVKIKFKILEIVNDIKTFFKK